MNHCPSLAQLQQLLADALSASDAQLVEKHAAACLDCQQVLERLAGTDPIPQRTTVDDHDAAFLRQLEAAPPWSPPCADSSLTMRNGAATTPESLPDLRVTGYEILN